MAFLSPEMIHFGQKNAHFLGTTTEIQHAIGILLQLNAMTVRISPPCVILNPAQVPSKVGGCYLWGGVNQLGPYSSISRLPPPPRGCRRSVPAACCTTVASTTAAHDPSLPRRPPRPSRPAGGWAGCLHEAFCSACLVPACRACAIMHRLLAQASNVCMRCLHFQTYLHLLAILQKLKVLVVQFMNVLPVAVGIGPPSCNLPPPHPPLPITFAFRYP